MLEQTMTEKYILTESNINELVKRINSFCEEGFHHTHDWLSFTDRPDKEFKELKFEKDYPSYTYYKGAKWDISKNFLNEPLIILDSNQNEQLCLTIPLGSTLLFDKEAIYVIEKKLHWSQMVGKYYK